MKKWIAIALALVLSGCTMTPVQDTTTSAAPTQTQAPTQTTPTQTTGAHPEETPGTAETNCARILGLIWEEFAEDEKFAAYGGTVEHAVSDAPGDLNLHNTEELTTKYLIPQDHIAYVQEAASLVHLMNNNIFTGAVFRVRTDITLRSFAQAVRVSIQNNAWICGQPDRLVIADMGGEYLLIAFGNTEIMENFQQKLAVAFPSAKVLHSEAISA